MTINKKILGKLWLPAAFAAAILFSGCQANKVKQTPTETTANYPSREVKGYSTLDESQKASSASKSASASAVSYSTGSDTIYEDHLVRLEKVYKSGSMIGSDFTYDIIVTAKRAVTNVEVDEFLPDSIRFKSATPAASMNQFGMPSWDLEALEAGDSETINVVVTPTKVGDYKVCSVVRADPLICLPLFVGQPELTITKTGPASAELGENVTWDIMVENVGNATADNVVITDTVPSGFTATSPVTKTVGDMQPGDTASWNVSAKSNQVGRFTNTAIANYTGGAPVQATAPIEVVQSEVGITKTGPATGYIFVPETYTITVTNKGSTTLNNLVVKDMLPDGAVLVGKVAQSGEVADTDSGRTILNPQFYGMKNVHGYWRPGSENPMADDHADEVSWTIPSLAAGASKSFNVAYHANKPMTTTNVATVTTDRGLTDRATADTVWKAVPGVQTTMVDSVDPIQVGEQTVYTLKTLNQSRHDTFTVTSQEVTIPSGLRIVSASQGGTISGNKVSFLPVTLGPRKEIDRTITVTGAQAGTHTSVMETMTNFRDVPVVDQESTTVY